MVAGLATITPASGNVGPMGALVIGILAGFVCYFMCGIIKEKLGIDDSLDVFAVHGVGGIMGTLLVSFLGNRLGGQGINLDSSMEQFKVQATGVLASVALSVVATVIIVKILEAVCGGIRASEEDIVNGLDQSHHGEKGYYNL
jgi:Amt family ammonium transporter